MDDVLEVVSDDYFPNVEVATDDSGLSGGGAVARAAACVLGAAWRFLSDFLIPSDEQDDSRLQDAVPSSPSARATSWSWKSLAEAIFFSPSSVIGSWEMSRTAVVALLAAVCLVGLLLVVKFRYRVYMTELHRLEREYPWHDDDE